jgi:hypothetical protein
MKARIIGTIFVLLVLGALYVFTYDDNQVHPANSSQPSSEPAFQPIKIN